MKRILHILPSLNSGGVEQALLDLATEMRHQNWPVFVASSGGFLQAQLEQLGCIHETLPLSCKTPLQLYKNSKNLENIIQKHSIQLLHVHSRAPAWSALWASRKCGIPMISTFHGVYNTQNSLKKLYNSGMVRGEKTIAISQFVANHIQHVYGDLNPSVITIPEGIDTEKFNLKNVNDLLVQDFRRQWQVHDQKVILLPGRLTRWKGQSVLLKALRHINTSNLQVVLMGDAQGRTAYQEELKELAAGLPVHFAPPTSFMPEAYAASDYVINCSTDPEAFGRVTAEAMAMERIYIGTNHGATPEMCIDHKTGLLVPPAEPERLADTLEKALNFSNDVKKKMGQQARRHVDQHFSLKHMVKETLGVYESFSL